MSRHSKHLSPSVILEFGDDHALGSFIQVIDNRYAGSEKDEQGEGFVFDWDQLFGASVNLIGLDIERFKDKDIEEQIVKLCDTFVKTIDKYTIS